jgi:outer membrane biosynthesis protein TonB
MHRELGPSGNKFKVGNEVALVLTLVASIALKVDMSKEDITSEQLGWIMLIQVVFSAVLLAATVIKVAVWTKDPIQNVREPEPELEPEPEPEQLDTFEVEHGRHQTEGTTDKPLVDSDGTAQVHEPEPEQQPNPIPELQPQPEQEATRDNPLNTDDPEDV